MSDIIKDTPVKLAYRCPACNGHGTVSRPPWIAGDQETWPASSIETYSCRACGGTGIVWSREAP